MGIVDTAESGKLKMKHFIIPFFKFSFLQTNPTSFRVHTFLNLCLFSLLGSLLSVPLFLFQCYSVREVFPFVFILHRIFLCSSQHCDVWLSTVTHSLCCKAVVDYSSVHVIPSFHPQRALHVFSRCIFAKTILNADSVLQRLPSLPACRRLEIY